MQRMGILPMWIMILMILSSSVASANDKDAVFKAPPLKVPDGYTVELAAGPPLVKHPVMACFDERGRLFVAETVGKNLKRAELEKQLPNFIRMLEDTDGDGKFDKSTIFADKLTFPQGVLPYNGAVYTCSSGALWKLVDTDGDNVADQRTKLVSDFGYTGNAADIHGPFLGPDGRLYWCQGRHGHEFKDKDGKIFSKGKAARIFSCKLDGSDVQTFCGGGMDNPVEIVFTEEGDMLGTCNLFYAKPRGDVLVHWVYGGVYPRYDFIDKLGGEFIHTGPPLTEVHNFGHVAVSGLCRYRSEHFGPNPAAGPNPTPNDPNVLFVTQFNTNKVVRVETKRHGSTYKLRDVKDFLVSTSKDFHPTDVLEDADGSLLVVDTGGWFRIGCPVSQVAKPDVKGGIYRIRKIGGKKYDDPRGSKLSWDRTVGIKLAERFSDERFVVRDRAERLFGQYFRWAQSSWATLALFKDESPDHAAEYEIADRLRSELMASDFTNMVDKPKRLMAITQRAIQPLGWRILGTKEVKQDPEIARAVGMGTIRYWGEGLNDISNFASLVSSDPSPFVRRVSARGLAELVVRPVIHQGGIRLREGPEPRVAVTKQLIAALEHPKNDEFLRHAIMYALYECGDRDLMITHRQMEFHRGHDDLNHVLRLSRNRKRLSDDPEIEIPAPSSGTPLSEKDKAALLDLEKSLPKGNSKKGEAVFISKKAACVTCHVTGAAKSPVDYARSLGPHLLTIGKRRSRRDLLESIVFPSASFARSYEPYVLRLRDGNVVSGVIVGESESELKIAKHGTYSFSVKVQSIESIDASKISVMPAGMDKALSRQEIADLLAYLESLK